MKVLRWFCGKQGSEPLAPGVNDEAPQEPDSAAGAKGVLRFTIGPVQGFIDQSRRTRDLWAGSFLLSWLSGQAMAVIDQDGYAILDQPVVGVDSLFGAIRAARSRLPGDPPAATGPAMMPSLPNELRAKAATPAHAAELAAVAARAVRSAWQDVAHAVLAEFLIPYLAKCDPDQQDRSSRIWHRQIGTEPDGEPFWEIVWAAGYADGSDRRWLDARKLGRPLRISPPEEGDLCTLMHDWQELSGHSRINKGGRAAQQAFWSGLRDHLAGRFGQGYDAAGKLLELAESERLCAIALVRRLFPLLPVERLAKVIGWYPEDADRALGKARRQPYSYRPSTAAIAIVHWLAKAYQHAPVVTQDFAKQVRNTSGALATAERHSPIDIVRDLGQIGDVDGKLFYESTIANECELPLDHLPEVQRKPQRDQLGQALKDLTKVTINSGEILGPPSPYYALLRMDGDGIGALVGFYGGRLSAVLGEFGRQVPQIVARHHAVPIYAGGDDLMVMAPLEDALALAEQLNITYRQMVQQAAPEATISAGLVFAHYQAPLSGVIEESRRLLDGVAKTINGRASLAASIYRIGGPVLTWATTFEHRDERDAGVQPRRPIAELDRLLAHGDHAFATLASNRVVFNARDRLSAFLTTPGAEWQAVVTGAAGGQSMPAGELALLLRAIGGEDALRLRIENVRAFVDLLTVHHRQRMASRQKGDDGYRYGPAFGGASFDAMLLFRFLAAQWRKPPAMNAVRRKAG